MNLQCLIGEFEQLIKCKNICCKIIKHEIVRYPDSLLSISSVENSTHGMSEGRTMSILGATLPFWAPMETLLCGSWLFADLSLPS